MSIEAILNERGKTHGDFRRQAKTAQELKLIVRQHEGWNKLRSDQKEAIEMILHKISRILNGDPNEPDHWIDIAGYSTLPTK